MNHQQNITIDEKLFIKNLQYNQGIIIFRADKGGKIVILNRDQSIKDCKKQHSDSTFYEQTVASNLQI